MIKDRLTSKQIDALKKCPNGEFPLSIFADKERNFLYPLLHKGYLDRWKCVDPSGKVMTFELTAKGKIFKDQLINVG
jgi:hypothetical protein